MFHIKREPAGADPKSDDPGPPFEQGDRRSETCQDEGGGDFVVESPPDTTAIGLDENPVPDERKPPASLEMFSRPRMFSSLAGEVPLLEHRARGPQFPAITYIEGSNNAVGDSFGFLETEQERTSGGPRPLLDPEWAGYRIFEYRFFAGEDLSGCLIVGERCYKPRDRLPPWESFTKSLKEIILLNDRLARMRIPIRKNPNLTHQPDEDPGGWQEIMAGHLEPYGLTHRVLGQAGQTLRLVITRDKKQYRASEPAFDGVSRAPYPRTSPSIHYPEAERPMRHAPTLCLGEVMSAAMARLVAEYGDLDDASKEATCNRIEELVQKRRSRPRKTEDTSSLQCPRPTSGVRGVEILTFELLLHGRDSTRAVKALTAGGLRIQSVSLVSLETSEVVVVLGEAEVHCLLAATPPTGDYPWLTRQPKEPEAVNTEIST